MEDINPNMPDNEKKGVYLERLWSLYDWMVAEYDIYEDVVTDSLKTFNQQLCDDWNEEEDDDE